MTGTALALVALAGCAKSGGGPATQQGQFDDRGDSFVFSPESVKRLPRDRKTVLVYGLSPTGDAGGLIDAWRAVVEKHQWIVGASRTFQNGVDFNVLLPKVETELRDLEAHYPVDSTKVILTGYSGGGMGAHAFVAFHPDLVRAVVVNTGMMEEAFRSASYPEGKLAVFLASPTDFRVGEMKADRAFLEAHHWTTQWLEFEGGHRLAPTTTYEQAAEWLATRL